MHRKLLNGNRSNYFVGLLVALMGANFTPAALKAENLTHCQRFGAYDPDCPDPKARAQHKSNLSRQQQQYLNALFGDIEPELRKVYVGIYGQDFAGLESLKDEQIEKATGPNTVIGLLNPLFPQLKRSIVSRKGQARYKPIIAQYALIKANTVGACNQPTVKFEVTSYLTTTIKNYYGVELSRTSVETGKRYFQVPSKFADLISDSNTKSEWPQYASGVRSMIERLGGCGSDELKELENNMLAYQNWDGN